MTTLIPTIKTLIKYMDVKTLEFRNLLVDYVGNLEDWELEDFILNKNPHHEFDFNFSCRSVKGQITHQIISYVNPVVNDLKVDVEVIHVLDFAGKLFKLDEVYENYEVEDLYEGF